VPDIFLRERFYVLGLPLGTSLEFPGFLMSKSNPPVDAKTFF